MLFAAMVLLAVYEGVSQTDAVVTLRVPNSETLSLVVADTAAERTRGLGGRPSLGGREGMLFVFSESGRHGIWMKDMRFSLDIIWLRPARTDARCAQNGAKKEVCLEVVDVREQVMPDTFPESFAPREEALYVLEINAGVAREMGIQRGETMLFAR